MGEKATKRKEYDTKKCLYFDFNKPNDVMIYELFRKAPKRVNKLIGIMAREFMDNFGITEEVPKEELIKIIDMYEIVKNMKSNPIMYQPGDFQISTYRPENITESHYTEKAETKDYSQKSLTKKEDYVKKETIENVETEQEDNIDSDFDDLENALSGFGFS